MSRNTSVENIVDLRFRTLRARRYYVWVSGNVLEHFLARHEYQNNYSLPP